jgi:hypothetical protein
LSDFLLAHAFGEQALCDCVVDLVRAGVREIFALEVDLRAAEASREIFGVVERRRAADVGLEQLRELGLERLVLLRLLECDGELVEGDHQRFGHEAAAVGAEVPHRVGKFEGRHTCTPFAARMKAAIFA